MNTNSYRCYAHFYNLNGVDYRQYLDIIKGDRTEAKKPELIIVMLNPGSCKPIDKAEEGPLVEVKRDATLHRVIALLHEKNITHARILNLSDIKQEKSNLLFETIQMRKQFNHYIIPFFTVLPTSCQH